MKKNKNIIALTMTLSMMSPIKSNDSFEEDNNHKAMESIEKAQESTEALCFTTIENTETIESTTEQIEITTTDTESNCNNHCNELTQIETALAAAIVMDTNQIINDATTQEETSLVITENDFDQKNENEIISEENITNNAIINLCIEYTETHASISISDELVATEKQDITLDQALILLQDAIANISLRIPEFEENDAQKLFTLDQAEALSTIISHVINAVATQIEIHQHQSLLEKDGIVLLQACANNLTTGSQFTLNGITYTIVASSENSKN